MSDSPLSKIPKCTKQFSDFMVLDIFFGHFGFLTFWFSDILVFGHFGFWTFWFLDILVFGHFGFRTFFTLARENFSLTFSHRRNEHQCDGGNQTRIHFAVRSISVEDFGLKLKERKAKIYYQNIGLLRGFDIWGQCYGHLLFLFLFSKTTILWLFICLNR
jgi:hypothetical protein